jgi:hypothetical protein
VDLSADLLSDGNIQKNDWKVRDGVLTYHSDREPGFIRLPADIQSRDLEFELELTLLDDVPGLSIDLQSNCE